MSDTKDIKIETISINGYEQTTAWFTGKIDWIAPASKKTGIFGWASKKNTPCIQEQRTINVSSRDDGPRVVTWESVFSVGKGRKSVEFTGDHFHGLGLRFVPDMNTGGRFYNSSKDEGTIFRGDERLRGGNWCAYTAKAQGKDVTVAMFDGKDNQRKATWFTMSKPFAFLGATIELYKTPYVLKKGKELKLRYGIAVWDGVSSDEIIEAEYQNWITQNKQ